jgi:hypothetical protein
VLNDTSLPPSADTTDPAQSALGVVAFRAGEPPRRAERRARAVLLVAESSSDVSGRRHRFSSRITVGNAGAVRP